MPDRIEVRERRVHAIRRPAAVLLAAAMAGAGAAAGDGPDPYARQRHAIEATSRAAREDADRRRRLVEEALAADRRETAPVWVGMLAGGGLLAALAAAAVALRRLERRRAPSSALDDRQRELLAHGLLPWYEFPMARVTGHGDGGRPEPAPHPEAPKASPDDRRQ